MVSSHRKRLNDLQKQDRYVFHGSGLQLFELEPRQAFTIVEGVNQADGEPAVFASHDVAYAIFMAIINQQNCNRLQRSRCQFDGVTHVFSASQETLDQLSEASSGYVHVFGREVFELRGGSEWRSFSAVKPVEIIRVFWSDFNHEVGLIAV